MTALEMYMFFVKCHSLMLELPYDFWIGDKGEIDDLTKREIMLIRIRLLDYFYSQVEKWSKALDWENRQRALKWQEWEAKHPDGELNFDVTLEQAEREKQEFEQWRKEYEAIHFDDSVMLA